MEFHRVHYLDASVLVKLIVIESGTDTIKKYMRAEHTSTFYATSLCFAETLGALKSKYLRKEMDQEAYLTACDVLSAYISDGISADIELVDVDISDSETFTEVENIVRRYGIDIVDAYQIVTINRDYWSRSQRHRPILVTADSDLAEAAAGEGLRVWDCLTDQPPLGVQ
jgi:predicted nucleic acid-binding protein